MPWPSASNQALAAPSHVRKSEASPVHAVVEATYGPLGRIGDAILYYAHVKQSSPSRPFLGLICTVASCGVIDSSLPATARGWWRTRRLFFRAATRAFCLPAAASLKRAAVSLRVPRALLLLRRLLALGGHCLLAARLTLPIRMTKQSCEDHQSSSFAILLFSSEHIIGQLVNHTISNELRPLARNLRRTREGALIFKVIET